MKMTTLITVVDDQHPEDVAMMQALYSRSAASVTSHLAKVKKSGSGKFMEQFYKGYGHESIGDCGTTTIFIEDVAIIIAKAIQDWALYCGQETSSRYIDFSKQGMSDPVGTLISRGILAKWMAFYHDNLEPLAEHLRNKYPIGEETLSVYNRAISARAFDILRAFLPAAVHTQLAWHTNLRQASNKLDLLIHHPDPEVRDVANAILDQLHARYPSSFCNKKYPATEQYRQLITSKYSYFDGMSKTPDDGYLSEEFFDGLEKLVNPNPVRVTTRIVPSDIKPYQELFDNRPIKAVLPHFLADLGQVSFTFLLDYGSWRDIQRHRNGVCRVPLLTTKHGFEDWYLDQLPAEMKKNAIALIAEQEEAINGLCCNEITRQYYVPLGYRVSTMVTYGLPAAIYTIELRSGVTVHPTLRRVAHNMKAALLSVLPDLVIHTDDNRDEWSVRRGTQDIIEK